MKPRSFFFRLFVGNLLLVGVIIAVSCVVSYAYLSHRHHRKELLHQHRLTLTFRGMFERRWPMDAEQVDRLCNQWVRELPARLTVVAADGRVLGDSDADPLSMENHKTDDRPELLAALAGTAGRSTRPSGTLGTEFRYLAEPIRKEGRVVGAVRVAVPVQGLVERRSFIWRSLVWSVLAAVCTAAAAGLLVSWLWSRPLRQITRTARRIASGDLSHRPPLRGSQELSGLADALNEMRRNLSRQIDTIATQRENLQTVVANMTEGLIALDAEGHIVLMNQSAIDMVCPEADDVVGRHVQSVVRVPEVADAVSRLSRRRTLRRQVELREPRRILDMRVAELSAVGAEGIRALVVLRDITDIARTAAVKAEFVANASHELRTPLATLRAAVDSLKSADPGDRETVDRLAGILGRHISRLEEMTQDLLDLHLLEQTRRELHVDDVRLGALAEWARGHFAAQAGDDGVTLDVRAEPADFTLHSDAKLLRMILQNLIDNGLKFTPTGGRVECLLRVEDDRLLLRVSDTGCGIPADLQERVFERFFQADPSRSGKARRRGTGLGLAIVKYAAERLGAAVELDSRVGRGTTVRVVLPLAAAA
jgi:two-component system phosphate regulon sensor histidine kinase PhoR